MARMRRGSSIRRLEWNQIKPTMPTLSLLPSKQHLRFAGVNTSLTVQHDSLEEHLQ